MKYEIKWDIDNTPFSDIWESLKKYLIKNVLPAAKERADDILRYIKAGHSDYIKKYCTIGDCERFYLIFNELFFKEPSEAISKYKKRIEQSDKIVLREEENKID